MPNATNQHSDAAMAPRDTEANGQSEDRKSSDDLLSKKVMRCSGN